MRYVYYAHILEFHTNIVVDDDDDDGGGNDDYNNDDHDGTAEKHKVKKK